LNLTAIDGVRVARGNVNLPVRTNDGRIEQCLPMRFETSEQYGLDIKVSASLSDTYSLDGTVDLISIPYLQA